MPDDWSHKAWMSVRDADILERVVFRVARERGSIDVFEWGSGKSTKYFSSELAAAKVPFSWSAVEHDPSWAASVREGLHDQANVLLVPLGDQYPLSIRGRSPSLVIVDGRLRRRCLIEASRLSSVIVLHDAQREYYHCAFSLFAYQGRVGDMLWIGCQDASMYERAHGR
jgi:hypothetical protein